MSVGVARTKSGATVGFVTVVSAFLKREFLIATSYKFQFVFNLTAGLFTVLGFYFIAKMIDSSGPKNPLQAYETDYFSFVLVGVAATGFLFVGVQGFPQRLREMMTEGSLEMMFACPIRPIWILILPSLWSVLQAGLQAVLMVAVGAVFGADFSRANFGSGLLLILLSIPAFSVFGLVSTAIIIIIKRGDPINWFFTQASSLLGGALFPLELLPSWLGWISNLLPMTYSYHGLRLSLLNGAGVQDVWFDLVVLGVFSVLGVPLACLMCNRAVEHAKRDGSLGSF